MFSGCLGAGVGEAGKSAANRKGAGSLKGKNGTVGNTVPFFVWTFGLALSGCLMVVAQFGLHVAQGGAQAFFDDGVVEGHVEHLRHG